MLLVGAFGADQAVPAPHRKAAIVSIAAALLVIMGLLLPSLIADDPSNPVTGDRWRCRITA